MKNQLIEKLRAGKTIMGLNNSCPAPAIIERMCRGWDFVWIDAQHGQHTYETVLYAARTAMSVSVESLIRVPGHEYGILGPYADMGVASIMVPMVDTAEQARKIVEALRFPPLGKRSFGARRAIDLYGRNFYRDRELLVIAQIESLEAVENARAIAAVEGIDMIFFGPDDMKVSLGIEINTPVSGNEKLLSAMRIVAQAAEAEGKYSGCVAATAEMAQLQYKAGYRLFMCGSDIGFIASGAEKKMEELKRVLL